MARKNKFSTNELKDIINRFLQEEKHRIMPLNNSNLAKYAQDELGLSGIQYYHFSRNKEINELVTDYSKTLKSDALKNSTNNNSFTTMNIKEFVKLNAGKEDRLIFFLTQIQEAQRKLYDRTVEAEFKAKNLENDLQIITEKKEKYRKKYHELRTKFEELKERSLVLADTLKLEEEKKFISALASMDLVVNNSKEVAVTAEDISNLDDQKDLEKLFEEYSDIFD